MTIDIETTQYHIVMAKEMLKMDLDTINRIFNDILNEYAHLDKSIILKQKRMAIQSALRNARAILLNNEVRAVLEECK